MLYISLEVILMKIFKLMYLFFAIFLSACGGGSGSNGDSTPSQELPEQASLLMGNVYYDLNSTLKICLGHTLTLGCAADDISSNTAQDGSFSFTAPEAGLYHLSSEQTNGATLAAPLSAIFYFDGGLNTAQQYISPLTTALAAFYIKNQDSIDFTKAQVELADAFNISVEDLSANPSSSIELFKLNQTIRAAVTMFSAAISVEQSPEQRLENSLNFYNLIVTGSINKMEFNLSELINYYSDSSHYTGGVVELDSQEINQILLMQEMINKHIISKTSLAALDSELRLQHQWLTNWLHIAGTKPVDSSYVVADIQQCVINDNCEQVCDDTGCFALAAPSNFKIEKHDSHRLIRWIWDEVEDADSYRIYTYVGDVRDEDQYLSLYHETTEHFAELRGISLRNVVYYIFSVKDGRESLKYNFKQFRQSSGHYSVETIQIQPFHLTASQGSYVDKIDVCFEIPEVNFQDYEYMKGTIELFIFEAGSGRSYEADSLMFRDWGNYAVNGSYYKACLEFHGLTTVAAEFAVRIAYGDSKGPFSPRVTGFIDESQFTKTSLPLVSEFIGEWPKSAFKKWQVDADVDYFKIYGTTGESLDQYTYIRDTTLAIFSPPSKLTPFEDIFNVKVSAVIDGVEGPLSKAIAYSVSSFTNYYDLLTANEVEPGLLALTWPAEPSASLTRIMVSDGPFEKGRDYASFDVVGDATHLYYDTETTATFYINVFQILGNGYVKKLPLIHQIYADTDKDGIRDDFDVCANTPLGQTVGKNGCSHVELSDNDYDTVPAHLDQCDNTRAYQGQVVDTVGCMPYQLNDFDGDGISNEQDTCSNTYWGSAVDSMGCSLAQTSDNDGDNVMAYLDLCPYTPDSLSVNIEGCAESELIDSDSDGISDAYDACAFLISSLPSAQSNAHGCTLQQQTDDDLDTVSNAYDLCLQTPTVLTSQVNSEGCAPSELIDSDGDSLPDAKDECKYTPLGDIDHIDLYGCGPDEADPTKPIAQFFAYRPDAYQNLVRFSFTPAVTASIYRLDYGLEKIVLNAGSYGGYYYSSLAHTVSLTPGFIVNGETVWGETVNANVAKREFESRDPDQTWELTLQATPNIELQDPVDSDYSSTGSGSNNNAAGVKAQDCIKIGIGKEFSWSDEHQYMTNSCSSNIHVYWCHNNSNSNEDSCGQKANYYKWNVVLAPSERKYNPITLPDETTIYFAACFGEYFSTVPAGDYTSSFRCE